MGNVALALILTFSPIPQDLKRFIVPAAWILLMLSLTGWTLKHYAVQIRASRGQAVIQIFVFLITGLLGLGIYRWTVFTTLEKLEPIEFLFKQSEVLTPKRQARIQNDLTAFAAYLKKIDLPLPPGQPPIEITSKQGSGAGGQLDGPTYYDTVTIKADEIDSQSAATQAYSTWVTMRLLNTSISKTKTFETLDEIFRTITPIVGTNMPAWNIFGQYFSDSYWGIQSNPTAPQPELQALWEIRSKCGQKFTDRLIAFTVRRFIDDNQKSYKGNFDEYFAERIAEADRIVDSESSQLPIIKKAMVNFGLQK